VSADPHALAHSAGLLFELPERAAIQVSGEERVRWLDGMLSADVQELEAQGPGALAPALVLTRQGRIVADPTLLLRAHDIWMDLEASAAEALIEHLEAFIIADDVSLALRRDVTRLVLVGPAGAAALRQVLGLEPPAPGRFQEGEIAGEAVLAASYGWVVPASLQLFVSGDAGPVVRALLEAGLVMGSSETLECLRIEAGYPRLGFELDQSVLPAEARMERAVSPTKGCYTGQEVVARLRSRDRVNHLLVGLDFDSAEPPSTGAALSHEGKRIGEVTSTARSPARGAIGLGFVPAALARAGTVLALPGEATARIVDLPAAGPG
jgi:folate-binding protein YgfZ